jgi:hypothetical protein
MSGKSLLASSAKVAAAPRFFSIPGERNANLPAHRGCAAGMPRGPVID